MLVVDDDWDIRTLISTALELEGWAVAQADGGIAGLAHLQSTTDHPPGVVVLDIQMPDLDGWEVLDHIRRSDHLDRTSVMMCTVRGGEEDRDRATLLGADAYITKPFDVDDLVATVSSLMSTDRRPGGTSTRGAP